MTDHLAILLLAAGQSTRMRGGDKQMEPIGGIPVLRLIAQAAAQTRMPCYVTLPTPDHPRSHTIQDMRMSQIYVADAHLGMGHSIAAGLRVIQPTNAKAVMICPTDLPDITEHHFETMIEAWHKTPNAVLRAADPAGKMGHPVIFPKAYFSALKNLDGDQGARDVLSQSNVRPVLFADHAPTNDLDTPEDWQKWRAQNERAKMDH